METTRRKKENTTSNFHGISRKSIDQILICESFSSSWEPSVKYVADLMEVSRIPYEKVKMSIAPKVTQREENSANEGTRRKNLKAAAAATERENVQGSGSMWGGSWRWFLLGLQ